MVPFFVGYAVIVWWLTCRHRRTPLGFGVLLAGVAGLMIVNWLHYEFGQWSKSIDPEDQGIFLPVLQSIMYPYTGLVAMVGLYLAVLPASHPPDHCNACGYDLRGVPARARVCPECGQRFASDPDQPAHRPSGVRRDDLRATDRKPANGVQPATPVPVAPSAPHHAVRDAAREDQPGHPRDQHPPDDLATRAQVAHQGDLARG